MERSSNIALKSQLRQDLKWRKKRGGGGGGGGGDWDHRNKRVSPPSPEHLPLPPPQYSHTCVGFTAKSSTRQGMTTLSYEETILARPAHFQRTSQIFAVFLSSNNCLSQCPVCPSVCLSVCCFVKLKGDYAEHSHTVLFCPNRTRSQERERGGGGWRGDTNKLRFIQCRHCSFFRRRIRTQHVEICSWRLQAQRAEMNRSNFPFSVLKFPIIVPSKFCTTDKMSLVAADKHKARICISHCRVIN